MSEPRASSRREKARQAEARWLAPIHHSTFRLTREPIERLVKAFDEARVVAPDVGQVWVER